MRKTGEVTPAGWQPGKPPLKSGAALAGKVWKEWKVENAFASGKFPAQIDERIRSPKGS